MTPAMPLEDDYEYKRMPQETCMDRTEGDLKRYTTKATQCFHEMLFNLCEASECGFDEVARRLGWSESYLRFLLTSREIGVRLQTYLEILFYAERPFPAGEVFRPFPPVPDYAMNNYLNVGIALTERSKWLWLRWKDVWPEPTDEKLYASMALPYCGFLSRKAYQKLHAKYENLQAESFSEAFRRLAGLPAESEERDTFEKLTFDLPPIQ